MFLRIILFFILLLPHAQFAAAGAIRAALVLEHEPVGAYAEGLTRAFASACRKYGVDGKVVVAGEKDREEIFRNCARENDLVIVATDAMHEILRDNAANFRRVMFGSIDAGIRAPNIMSVTFKDEEAAFLAGAAAAMLAYDLQGQNAVIGWLSGADVPAIRSLFNGYAEGAILARPGTRIVQAVAGSFTNPDLAAQKAEWLRKSGACVIALACGAGSEAARKALEGSGAWLIDLDSVSGKPALGAITKDLSGAMEKIVASAASGKFAGKEIVVEDLTSNGVDFIFADKHMATIPAGANIARRIAELKREFARGTIRVQSLRQRTLCDCLD